ncbi:hypothetical protein BJV38_000287 [Clostridium beijerinckii]|uniref:Uncharacterized protein n=1 Tax=Clostridium beijerinckii TaxID=1520 RepID=A0AAX0B7E2_CLOBE|nr:hypothetical protein [Clostridium beijerinckii]NRT43444.1 hypothetical protein [Clostridium beijerinckii]NRT91305.1 hypothetical protein [Clostridium beijerinckii]NRZ22565.1 hypothetical protein [Clostridium beijerinckii]NYC70830.1 hypothetical protein [Clostridium beijerinckii]
MLIRLDADMVAKGTGLSVDEVLKIKGELS